MHYQHNRTLALFYCQNVPGASERERIGLEKKYGQCIRFYPVACSGRLEPVHLLSALENFADAAYLITCPEGICRYFEGNLRAIKRVKRTQDIISGIGLERERVGIITGSKEDPKSLAELAKEIFDKVLQMEPSPVLKKGESNYDYCATEAH
jgi:F420-non-reducing hydrogenase iron-sulfur subunit